MRILPFSGIATGLAQHTEFSIKDGGGGATTSSMSSNRLKQQNLDSEGMREDKKVAVLA
jgi:hypothetical protein